MLSLVQVVDPRAVEINIFADLTNSKRQKLKLSFLGDNKSGAENINFLLIKLL